MNRYQDFYNQQRERKGPCNQQNRRSIFNNVRKERRTRMFDLFRGDIATNEPEAIKPVSKFTFRDTINKLIREKRKKVIQKPRPFVVGTVKHKIHSPPFLHEGCKFREPKRMLITPVQKSFAPSNYKFKIPKGLAVNLETPLEEENPVTSPFVLNTVWNKLNNKNTRRKEFMHDNVTHREKKRTYMNPSLTDAFSTANENSEQKSAKRELWPEAFDEGPIFGRLNMERMSRSLDKQPDDNEKEASDSSQVNISHSVLPDSSFNKNSEEKLDKENIQNSELKGDSNVEPNITSMSTKSIQSPVANTSRMSNGHESEMPTSNAETMQMDYRLSRISPPKAILSNTIFNFDNSETHIEKDNTDLEDINLPCSTPSVQNFFKDIQVQFENSSDPSTTSTPSIIKNNAIEAAPPTISPVEESPTVHNVSKIEDSNFIIESERTSSDIGSSENRQKILNLTFTKSLGLIEEDEEEETVKLNLEYLSKEHKKKDNINSSPVLSILKSSNVDKSNVESENLLETECNRISFDNAPKSKNTSSAIENNENSEEIPSLSKSNLQDSCNDQTINAILENAVSSRKSPEKLINQIITNISPGLASNQTNLDKDESLKNSSETPVKIIPNVNIEFNSSEKLYDDQSQSKETEQLITTSNSTLSNSPTPFRDQPTNVNYTETIIKMNNKDSCSPCNLSLIGTSSRRITENKNVSSAADIESDHSQATESEHLVGVSNSISSNGQILSEVQLIEVDYTKSATENINKGSSEPCDLSSVSTSNCRITENENVNSDAETDSDHSQAKESEELVATTNSTSSNSPVLFEDQLTEVNHAKSASGDNNGNCNGSRISSSINTSNHRITEEKNTSLGRIVYSCPTKLIDNVESDHFITSNDISEVNSTPPSQLKKEKDLAAKTQHTPDSTASKKIISNESSKTRTPRETSPVFKIEIKITSPNGMTEPVFQVVTEDESAHAGPVQSRDSISIESVIDLTDSPVSASRKSMKPEFIKSALDYKPSPLFFSNQKRNSYLSGSDENAVIDLISDDEDDHTSFLSNLLKKYALTSDSSKQSPRNRIPLASIGNISRLSASRTSQSPLVNKVNSPAKKTPVSIADIIPRLSASRTPQSPLAIRINSPSKKTQVLITETIPIVHVSPPATPLEMLHDTPRNTPRRRKALKEIATETVEVPSPLRVMNLRNRNISVSPSPKKKTPCAVTPRKTPVKFNVVKEVEAEAPEDTGHLRVMNLRSRNVNVSPSPKKMTPRRRKNDNQCV